MATANIITQGREAFRKQMWADAFSQLSNADQEAPLKPEDLELLARAAYMTGNSADCNDIWARAHNDYLNRGNVQAAIRCAFWLGLILLNKGEPARGSGWIARANRMLEEGQIDCVEKGYLLIPLALKALSGGDAKSSLEHFEQAGRVGEKFRDADLMALSRLGRGQALVRLQEIPEGVALLDEAMVAVDSGEVSPIVTGIIYCAVVETCLEIFDLQRAHEWTEALSDWCASQPQLVPYRGQCLIRRSEIMQLHGKWTDAFEEAYRACEILTRPKGEPSAGAAFYQLGELHRLRGNFNKAEEAYKEANQWGRKPQPGLALLRLAQGKIETARTSIQQVLQEANNLKSRTRALPAYIEIMIASNNLEDAHTAAEELVAIANKLDAPPLYAMAAYGEGAVLLAEGKTQLAMEKLRTAVTIWEQLEAPYEKAKVRRLIGLTYREMGDEETAAMECEAAMRTFHELKANPDITRFDQYFRNKNSGHSQGLTQREMQVIRQIAHGKSNKVIAEELFISERTVERHVSNIFSKLNVSSRSAITAYAYKQELV